VSKSITQTIKVVIPDAGPLISLSMAEALDVLLVFKDEVRIVITDFVEFEVTRFRDRRPDAQRICDFIARNAGIVEIQETQFGKTMKEMFRIRERFDEDENFRRVMASANISAPSLPKDAGELSIVSFANDLITSPPGTPILILAEDDFFLHSGSANPGNAHILSTRAFLETLQQLGKVADADAIWRRIQEARNTVNAASVNREAAKIKTDRVGAVDDKKAGNRTQRRRRPTKSRGDNGPIR
jgi:hypothetical protein